MTQYVDNQGILILLDFTSEVMDIQKRVVPVLLFECLRENFHLLRCELVGAGPRFLVIADTVTFLIKGLLDRNNRCFIGASQLFPAANDRSDGDYGIDTGEPVDWPAR